VHIHRQAALHGACTVPVNGFHQVQVRKPDDSTLAFLLGLALGVMATLSIVELWIKNALENGPLAISAATVAGALVYYIIQPFVPEYEVPFC
jgi:zinc transporter ZupT